MTFSRCSTHSQRASSSTCILLRLGIALKSDRLGVAPQDGRLTLAALLLQPGVEIVPRRKPRQRHHEVAPGPADQTLDAALVIAFTRPAIAVSDRIRRQEPAEQPGPSAGAIRQDARHQAPVIVVEHRQRHPAEKSKRVNVAGRRPKPRPLPPDRLGCNSRRSAADRAQRSALSARSRRSPPTLRQNQPGRGQARGAAGQHLPMAALMFANVILDDGVAAGEPVLVPQPIKNPLGRVTLLAVLASVIAQPLVDDLDKPVQLRPLDRRCPPIPRRYRKPQHLLHALARNPKVTRRLARTHPVPKGETNLQIQFHGENAPALPAERKGKSGRVFPRQQGDYPAATVADFLSAVLTTTRRR